MEKTTQREAVFQAVTKLANLESKLYVSHLVVREVIQDFQDGRTEFKVTERNIKRLSDESDLRKYVESLVKNWQKKDKRLSEYSPIAPEPAEKPEKPRPEPKPKVIATKKSKQPKPTIPMQLLH